MYIRKLKSSATNWNTLQPNFINSIYFKCLTATSGINQEDNFQGTTAGLFLIYCRYKGLYFQTVHNHSLRTYNPILEMALTTSECGRRYHNESNRSTQEHCGISISRLAVNMIDECEQQNMEESSKHQERSQPVVANFNGLLQLANPSLTKPEIP